MEIIVSDTNIFIDLYSVGLLEAMCALPYDVRTVDFVVAEIINPEQTAALSALIADRKVKVESFDWKELEEILDEHSNVPGNISIPDCSVCYYARKYSATLLTGDRQLRRYAETCNVPVRGILFIFDQMVMENILLPKVAAEKLLELVSINIRLPKSEVEKRISAWKK